MDEDYVNITLLKVKGVAYCRRTLLLCKVGMIVHLLNSPDSEVTHS